MTPWENHCSPKYGVQQQNYIWDLIGIGANIHTCWEIECLQYALLPWPLPERQSMVLWPPCRVVIRQPVSNWTDKDRQVCEACNWSKEVDFIMTVAWLSHECWKMIVGNWSLTIYCWKLIAGYWLLEIDCWKLIDGNLLLEIDCWILIAGNWLLEINCLTLIAGNWLMKIYCWKFIDGNWYLEIDCLKLIAGN